MRYVPRCVLPALLDLPSAALEASLSGSRQTSGTKKSLEFQRSAPDAEMAFWSGCLFNFISFICSSVIGTISGDRHDSAPIEFVFCLAEVGRAERWHGVVPFAAWPNCHTNSQNVRCKAPITSPHDLTLRKPSEVKRSMAFGRPNHSRAGRQDRASADPPAS